MTRPEATRDRQVACASACTSTHTHESIAKARNHAKAPRSNVEAPQDPHHPVPPHARLTLRASHPHLRPHRRDAKQEKSTALVHRKASRTSHERARAAPCAHALIRVAELHLEEEDQSRRQECRAPRHKRLPAARHTTRGMEAAHTPIVRAFLKRRQYHHQRQPSSAKAAVAVSRSAASHPSDMRGSDSRFRRQSFSSSPSPARASMRARLCRRRRLARRRP